MPTHVKIIRAGDFLLATPKGQIDFENSKRLLVKIESASATLVTHEVLLDMRSLRVSVFLQWVWTY